MKTMANLPTSGQQYWGASLNNYIRSLESKITNIENNLSKKGLATAYLGSGWTDGDYKFGDGSDEDGYRSPGVYDLSSDSSVTIEGNENQSLIFFGQAQITTKTVKETIDFSGLNCIITTVNGGDVTYAFDGSVGIEDIDDGFFPIYICLDVGGAIKFGISCLVVDDDFKPGSFVYHEDFVLLGLIEKINGSYSFIKQTYTARKSLLDTRRDLLVPFATITNVDGLFEREGVTGSSTLTLYLDSLTLDYQVGGIISSDNRDNAILDYKRFDSTGRRVFKKNAGWMVSYPADETIYETASTDGEIYGIYISISGDIFIDSLQGVTAEYANWSLNTTNEFKNAGLVLLGAYSGTEFWYAKDNGLSPAFITTRELPTDSIINFPDVQLASSINRLDKVSPIPPEIYELKIINDEIFKTNTVRNLNLDLDYVDSTPDMILDYSILALPTFEDQSRAYKYWEILKGGDNNFLGTRLMSLTLNTSGAATIDGSLTVNGAATLSESLTVDGAVTVNESLTVDDKVTASSLKVGKAATTEELLTVMGKARVINSLIVGGLKTTDNILTVKGSAEVNGRLTLGTDVDSGTITCNREIGIYSPTFGIIMGESSPDEFGTVEDRFELRCGASSPIKLTQYSTKIGVAKQVDGMSKIALEGDVNVTGKLSLKDNVTSALTVEGILTARTNLNIDGNLILPTLTIAPQNYANQPSRTLLSGGNLSVDYSDHTTHFVSLDVEGLKTTGNVIISNGCLIVDDILVRRKGEGGDYYSLAKMLGVK